MPIELNSFAALPRHVRTLNSQNNARIPVKSTGPCCRRQGDAETWLGEQWRNLLDAGVDQVSLLEDGRCEYGPMNLHPAEG